MDTPYLSIIIPTVNEEANIARLLSSLPLERVDTEVIVVDGESADQTCTVASTFPVRILRSRPGRGVQLSRGAEHSAGKVLWFLHADSIVDGGHVNAILAEFDKTPGLIGGNFCIHFDGEDEFSRWLNQFYAYIRQQGFYYGDSGIFIARATLDLLGGVPRRRVMEDFALVRRMECTVGNTVCIARPAIISSSRRFYGRQKWRIIAGWLCIHLLYYLRLPDAWLAFLYDNARRRQRPRR